MRFINSSNRYSKVDKNVSMQVVIIFIKQKTAYEMRISDWSSDVCSSDLPGRPQPPAQFHHGRDPLRFRQLRQQSGQPIQQGRALRIGERKRVVVGESELAREDIGGRRISNKITRTKKNSIDHLTRNFKHLYKGAINNFPQ